MLLQSFESTIRSPHGNVREDDHYLYGHRTKILTVWCDDDEQSTMNTTEWYKVSNL